tara:strand:- start:369 stop:776 length:408 start_codon:yes stop_codon:yes gene_type:complete
MESLIDFEDIVLIQGEKKIVWEWIGEGKFGDFDPDDPDDVALLRFSCYEFLPEDRDTGAEADWYALSDASYCTRLSIDSPLQLLVMTSGDILSILNSGAGIRIKLSKLSWVSTSDKLKKRFQLTDIICKWLSENS